MGKNDSWLGLSKRAAGVKQKESKKRKICMCVFWALCFVLWVIIGGLHLERAINADNINADYKQFPSVSNFKSPNWFPRGKFVEETDGRTTVYSYIDEAYDACNLPRFERDPKLSDRDYIQIGYDYEYEGRGTLSCDYCENIPSFFNKGTGWTGIWVWSAYIMLASALNFIMLMIGSWFFWPRLLGTLCNCVSGCFIFGVSLDALLTGFSPYAELCSYNLAPVDYEGSFTFNEDGRTYQDDAKLLYVLAILQFILMGTQCTCCCIPLAMTPIGETKKKEYKTQGHQMVQTQQQMYPGVAMAVPVDQNQQQTDGNSVMPVQMMQPGMYQQYPAVSDNQKPVYDTNGQPVQQP